MGRRGRPRKRKKITYESKETKVFLGLVCLILSGVAVLTYLVEGNSLILKNAKSIFGDATFLAALLFFNLGFYLLNARYSFASKRSLIGQALFLISILMIFTLVADKEGLLIKAKDGQMGGLAGYYLTRFLERQVFAQFTILVAFILLFVSLPLMLVMTISEFIAKLGNKLKGVKDAATENLQRKGNKQEEEDKPAETFGDFRKKMDNFNNLNTQNNVKDKPPAVKQPEVVVKEASDVTDDAVVNEELQFPDWQLPSVTLLNDPPAKRKIREDIRGKSEVIEQTLRSFGINAKVVDVAVGPTVTQYAIDIPLGTKVSKIANLKNIVIF